MNEDLKSNAEIKLVLMEDKEALEKFEEIISKLKSCIWCFSFDYVSEIYYMGYSGKRDYNQFATCGIYYYMGCCEIGDFYCRKCRKAYYNDDKALFLNDPEEEGEEAD